MVIWQQNLLHFGADEFSFRNSFWEAPQKPQNRLFRFAVEIHPVLQQQFLTPPRKTIVFCNSVSADCSGMAASRFLAPAAACVLLLSSMLSVVDCIGVAASRLRWSDGDLAAEFTPFWRWWSSFRNSFWEVPQKPQNCLLLCGRDPSGLAAAVSVASWEVPQKPQNCLLLCGRDPSGLAAAVSVASGRNSIVFWKSVSADRYGVAAHMQVPCSCGCMRTTIVFCSRAS